MNNDIKEQLKEKFDYSDDLCEFLDKAIPAILNYYGEDKKELLNSVLLSCEIHIQKEGETYQDFMNSYFNTDKDWSLPTLASAVQQRELFVEEDEIKSKSVIYIANRSKIKEEELLNNQRIQSYIIHELCHAMKSSREIERNGNEIIVSSGLAKEKYIYNEETGELIESPSELVGIEEGLNSIAESEIMTMITGQRVKENGYFAQTAIARKLIEDEELKELLLKGQFEKDEAWAEYLGKDKEVIIDACEEMNNTIHLPASIVRNKELRTEIIQKANKKVEKAIEVIDNRNKEKSIQEMLKDPQPEKSKSKDL